jgi:hypothetical protein
MNQQGSTPFDWKAFSQRTWVVVVSGLVFPPLGIFLSWRKADWAPKAKWIATGLMGLLLLWRMGGSEKPSGSNTERPEKAATVEAPVNTTAGSRKYKTLCTGLGKQGFRKRWEGVLEDLKNLSDMQGGRGAAGAEGVWPPPDASERKFVYVAASLWHKQTKTRDGEDDSVVLIAEIVPKVPSKDSTDVLFTRDNSVSVRGILSQMSEKASRLFTTVKEADPDFHEQLSWLDNGTGNRQYKSRVNGNTDWRVIWIVGKEVAEVRLPTSPTNRWQPLPYDGTFLYDGIATPCTQFGDEEGLRRTVISKLIKFWTGGALEP